VSRKIIPLTLNEADVFIRQWHRDHKRHPAIKLHRFSLGLLEGDKLIGAIIVSFPMARLTDLHQVAEVQRLAADGSKDAASQLLGAATRVCREMGFARFQMFVAVSEKTAPAFLKAANFTFDGVTNPSPWEGKKRTKYVRSRRPVDLDDPKHRWVIDFAPIQTVTPGRRKCDGCKRHLPLGSRPNKRTCSDACRQRLARRRALGRKRIAE
jgi:hypothetical protein